MFGSLGMTEVLFILVLALIIFGPRKLPQLGKTLGESLAQFRKASEDFKRTWEAEVTVEEKKLNVPPPATGGAPSEDKPATESKSEPSSKPEVSGPVTPAIQDASSQVTPVAEPGA
jgi:sec-independent protein translocase protein TatA